MTRKEAIAILSDMKIDIPVPKAAVMQTKRNVALDMAIGALRCSEIPNSSDCISRQAAIDAVEKESQVDGAYGYMDTKSIIDLLCDLPSAQPEPNYDEWCTDCKEYDQEQHCCPRWNRVIRQTLKDAQPELPSYVAEIEEEYQKAVKSPYIHKPLAKALYEVWKKHDREDVERRTDDEQ